MDHVHLLIQLSELGICQRLGIGELVIQSVDLRRQSLNLARLLHGGLRRQNTLIASGCHCGDSTSIFVAHFALHLTLSLLNPGFQVVHGAWRAGGSLQSGGLGGRLHEDDLGVVPSDWRINIDENINWPGCGTTGDRQAII